MGASTSENLLLKSFGKDFTTKYDIQATNYGGGVASRQAESVYGPLVGDGVIVPGSLIFNRDTLVDFCKLFLQQILAS
jgi:hypothetical protein